MVATPLPIHDASKTITYTQAILNFIMLGQYILYNNKTFDYLEYALYKLKNIKIAFKHH